MFVLSRCGSRQLAAVTPSDRVTMLTVHRYLSSMYKEATQGQVFDSSLSSSRSVCSLMPSSPWNPHVRDLIPFSPYSISDDTFWIKSLGALNLKSKLNSSPFVPVLTVRKEMRRKLKRGLNLKTKITIFIFTNDLVVQFYTNNSQNRFLEFGWHCYIHTYGVPF